MSKLPEEAEASILGCILFYPDTKEKVAKLISASDFQSPIYAACFSAAIELEEMDSTLFIKAVKRRGISITNEFIRQLSEIAVVPSNVELYAELLREASMKRQLEELAIRMKSELEKDKPSADVITLAMDKIKEIESKKISNIVSTSEQAMQEFWKHRELVDANKGIVKTGIVPLDNILGGGMLNGGFYVLAARPAMGKTTLGLQIGDNIAGRGEAVLFVALEMTQAQLSGKRIAKEIGISSSRILLGSLSDQQADAIAGKSCELAQLPFYISKKASVTVSDVRIMAKSVPNLACVIIDYLGLLSPEDRRSTSRYEITTQISGDIKRLAVELGVPILTLAQLNRGNVDRNDKRPQMSDLRDSGSIEQDADGIIMLHREDYYEMQEREMKTYESTELEIIVRKNRHGRIGYCKTAYFPATGKIVEVR